MKKQLVMAVLILLVAGSAEARSKLISTDRINDRCIVKTFMRNNGTIFQNTVCTFDKATDHSNSPGHYSNKKKKKSNRVGSTSSKKYSQKAKGF